MNAADLPFAHACPGAPPRVFIIAELGVNHDGRLDRALDLLAQAKGAGADAVKLQLFHPDRLLSAEARLAEYQASAATDAAQMLGDLALSIDDLQTLRAAARDADLKFILTPFSVADVQELGALDIDMIKIASPDAVNTPLLDAVAALGKPLLISTGTCDLEELTPAATRLAGHRAGGALLQCVSAYPTPDPSASLAPIAAMAVRFKLCTGYSDHTTAVDTGALAVAAGACVLEKHLTYDAGAQGPDHAASLAPQDFASYVALARRAAAMLGPTAKTALPIERDVALVSRQSLVATRDMAPGHVLAAADVTAKRPGSGIPAATSLVGRTLARPVQANHLIHWADLVPGPD